MELEQLSNDLAAMMAEDTVSLQKDLPKSEKLKELTKLIEKLTAWEDHITKAENILKAAKEAYSKYDSLLIPDLFDELGVRKITLSDGRVVEVKLKYTASITDENSEACFNWLEKHNHDSIIKREVKVSLKKGEKKEHDKIVAALTKLGISFTDKNSVHPQTLYAFVREQIESGSDFPKDLFKVYPLRSTKVK